MGRMFSTQDKSSSRWVVKYYRQAKILGFPKIIGDKVTHESDGLIKLYSTVHIQLLAGTLTGPNPFVIGYEMGEVTTIEKLTESISAEQFL